MKFTLVCVCVACLCGILAAQEKRQEYPARPVGAPYPLNSATLSQYIDRLRSEGSEASYEVTGPVDVPQGARETWYARNMVFRRGGIIYLGSNDFTLEIRGALTPVEDSQLLFASFRESDLKAVKGADGGEGNPGTTSPIPASAGNSGGTGSPGRPGGDGKKAGDLTLLLRAAPVKRFRISLAGQSGGDGGRGGAGGRGGTGQKGRPGDSGIFGCNRGGDNGGPGGRGGDGGPGGSGGACGNGGHVLVQVPRILRDRVEDLIRVDITLAKPGNPGEGGQGGSPGAGGQGGDGSGFCGGGAPGGTLGQGSPGPRGGAPGGSCQPPSPLRIITYN